MGRFVIVDHYEIAGGGIITGSLREDRTLLNEHISERERAWEPGGVALQERIAVNRHKPKFIVFCGEDRLIRNEAARTLERKLFEGKHQVYYLGSSNIVRGLDSDYSDMTEDIDEYLRRLGELARIVTGSGQILITDLPSVDDYDLLKLKELSRPNDFISVLIGEDRFCDFRPDLNFNSERRAEDIAREVYTLLRDQEITTLDYHI